MALPVPLPDLRRGDPRAFEAIMRQYNRRLFRAARAILKNDAEAEEAVQDAYVLAFTHLDQFAGPDGFASWLTRIAVNEALGRRRRQSRVRTFADLPEAAMQDDTDHTPIPLWSKPSDPEQQAAGAEMRRLIEQAVDRLPEAYRTVFVLREVEQLSVIETAACLGIPPATVRTRLFRAREALQRMLRAHAETVLPSAFSFAGDRCDRIVATVLSRLR